MPGSFRQGITTGKCKTKTIPTDLDIFAHITAYIGILKHNQTCPGIIQTYSEPCVPLVYLNHWYIQNLGIFRTLVDSESRRTQKPGIFRTLAYSESEAYSEYCRTSTLERFVKIVNG